MGLQKIAKVLKRFAIQLNKDELDDEDVTILRNGFNEFVRFFKENAAQAQKEKKAEEAGVGGSIKMYRLLDSTSQLLVHRGVEHYAEKYNAYSDYWREQGKPAIAEAFDVRGRQAMAEEPEDEFPEDEYNVDGSNYSFVHENEIQEENSPITQMSVAKALRFAELFLKTAKVQS